MVNRKATNARLESAEHSNLTPHRLSRSVWDKRGWHGVTIEERLAPWLVSLGGAGVFAYGASRRSRRGAPFMATGIGVMVLAAAAIASRVVGACCGGSGHKGESNPIQ